MHHDSKNFSRCENCGCSEAESPKQTLCRSIYLLIISFTNLQLGETLIELRPEAEIVQKLDHVSSRFKHFVTLKWIKELGDIAPV